MNKIMPLLLMALLTACGGEPEKSIDLPALSVLPLSAGWGVVLTNYVRLRTTPAVDGVEVTALAKGAVVRILDKGERETVKGVDDFWYALEAGSNRGWLFGAHLKVFHTREEATQGASEATRGASALP